MNIKNRINARKAFVTIVLNSIMLSTHSSEVNIEGEPYFHDMDTEFLQNLLKIYESKKQEITQFIETEIHRKTHDANQLALMICGICELLLGTDHKLVIKEYMIISDKTGGNAGLVNVALDIYYKKHIISQN